MKKEEKEYSFFLYLCPLPFVSMKRESAEMDITPMIDVVFLLLIFFVVCSTIGRTTAVQLPKAKIGVAVNPKTATVLTLHGFENDAIVTLGEGADVQPLAADRETQREEIIQAVERGLQQGKHNVVIKADRRLYHGEVHRVESAAAVPGITLNIVVAEE